MSKKSAHSFICQHSLIQWSCDASLGCSLLRRNGAAVSEMKLNLMMHASSKKNCFAKEFISKMFNFFPQTSTVSGVAHLSSLFLLIQVATGCCLFKGSTAEKEKQMWKRKKLTSLHSNPTKYCQWLRKYRKCNGRSHGFLCNFRRAHTAAMARQAGEWWFGAGEATANTWCSTLR